MVARRLWRWPVLAGCRQSAGKGSGRRVLPPATRRRPFSLAEPPSQETMLGATPLSLAGSDGAQSWQGAGRVPARTRVAIPPSTAAPPAPLLNRRARRRCWAQHHGRSQRAEVSFFPNHQTQFQTNPHHTHLHIQLRHYRPASTRWWPDLAGCRQSAGEGSGRYPTGQCH